MPTHRLRASEVDAVQWFGALPANPPKWLSDALEAGMENQGVLQIGEQLHVFAEGLPQVVGHGDWIAFDHYYNTITAYPQATFAMLFEAI